MVQRPHHQAEGMVMVVAEMILANHLTREKIRVIVMS
jgi:hypothetical protein